MSFFDYWAPKQLAKQLVFLPVLRKGVSRGDMGLRESRNLEVRLHLLPFRNE